MVKQDAMNVFLGCFVPNEVNIPLWDLESDYHLHNKALRPPEPHLNKVLFEEIISDNKVLLNPLVTQINECAIKRILSYFIDQSAIESRQHEKIPLVFTAPLPNASNSETALVNKLLESRDIISFLQRIHFPSIDLAAILRRYYIRSIATAERSTASGKVLTGAASSSTSSNTGSNVSLVALEAVEPPQSSKWGKFR